MRNVLQELLDIIELEQDNILCAMLKLETYPENMEVVITIKSPGGDLNADISPITENLKNCHGVAFDKMQGYVWLKSGAWITASRCVKGDPNMYWEYNCAPEIPEALR